MAYDRDLRVLKGPNTRVNDQPMLELHMLVHLPVRVDPNDRAMMAIAWQ